MHDDSRDRRDWALRTEHRTQLRRALVASTIGTTIEWYDFLLYGQVTGLVFGKLFFPHSDPLVGVLQAFAVFFIGFVGRPIGAAIFGHWGDRIGRKATLIATLLVTGLATVAVGLVPTYASIGIWGAVLLTVIRLIQGIGVGGEWGGSVLLAMEWAQTTKNRGFISAWPQFGGPAGLFLANIAVLFFSWVSGDHFLTWGWRIPFLLSLVMVAIGLWIRLGIVETPVFPPRHRRRARRARAGARSAEAPAETGSADRVFADAGTGAGLYCFHLHFYLRDDDSRGGAQFCLVGGPRPGRPCFYLGRHRRPFVGSRRPQEHVHDRLRVRRRVRLYLFRDARHQGAGIDVHRDRAVLAPAATCYGPQAALIAESFTPRLRYSGTSLGYQLASIIAGGPSPFIATALFARFHSSLPIALYILATAVIGIIATAMLTDYTNKDISAEYDNV